MLEQLALFAFCGAVWAFFHFTTGAQRREALKVVLWGCFVIGALGLVAEVAMRGGGLPFSW